MHAYGFSTGALALGDFESGLRMLVGSSAKAVELSALRDCELPALIDHLDTLSLDSYDYVSVHAPSRFRSLPEATCAKLLRACVERGWPVVVHPDAIQDPSNWDGFGELLCIENMDKRKSDGRTAQELYKWFERFPEAGFCLDLGHARQVDPSLTIARILVREFEDRLTQIHLSELDVQSRHRPLSMGSVVALRSLSRVLRPVAVILESQIEESEVERELQMAREVLGEYQTA